MTVNLRAVAAFIGFLAVFAVLLAGGQAGNTFMRAAFWAVIVAISGVGVGLTIVIWSGAYQRAAVPKRLRRWLLGEADR